MASSGDEGVDLNRKCCYFLRVKFGCHQWWYSDGGDVVVSNKIPTALFCPSLTIVNGPVNIREYVVFWFPWSSDLDLMVLSSYLEGGGGVGDVKFCFVTNNLPFASWCRHKLWNMFYVLPCWSWGFYHWQNHTLNLPSGSEFHTCIIDQKHHARHTKHKTGVKFDMSASSSFFTDLSLVWRFTIEIKSFQYQMLLFLHGKKFPNLFSALLTRFPYREISFSIKCYNVCEMKTSHLKEVSFLFDENMSDVPTF